MLCIAMLKNQKSSPRNPGRKERRLDRKRRRQAGLVRCGLVTESLGRRHLFWRFNVAPTPPCAAGQWLAFLIR